MAFGDIMNVNTSTLTLLHLLLNTSNTDIIGLTVEITLRHSANDTG